MAGIIGTILAGLGGVIALFNLDEHRAEPGFVFGAVMLGVGLLLRIEQAVRDTKG